MKTPISIPMLPMSKEFRRCQVRTNIFEMKQIVNLSKLALSSYAKQHPSLPKEHHDKNVTAPLIAKYPIMWPTCAPQANVIYHGKNKNKNCAAIAEFCDHLSDFHHKILKWPIGYFYIYIVQGPKNTRMQRGHRWHCAKEMDKQGRRKEGKQR